MDNNYAAAEELMKWKHAVQSQESKEDREKRIKKVCKKCIYWSGCCNYILDEGHQRPCPSTMCKEMGVYVRGKRKPGAAKRWNEGLF